MNQTLDFDVPWPFKDQYSAESKVLEVEQPKHPKYFETQSFYTYFNTPLEENEDLRPYLDRSKSVNISLLCALFELMNTLLLELIDHEKNFLTKA